MSVIETTTVDLFRYAEEMYPTAFRHASTTMSMLLDGMDETLLHTGENHSKLTPSGRPIEFNMTSIPSGLRYTVDFGYGLVSTEEKVTRILEWLRLQKHDPYLPPLAEDILAIHPEVDLVYGGWLGVRHVGAETVYKVYLEWPEAVAELGQKYGLTDVWQPIAELAKPVMLGIHQQTGELEYYFQAHRMRSQHLWKLMKILGFEGVYSRLTGTLSEFLDRAIVGSLPGFVHGFSLSQGTPSSFTLYLMAGDVFDHDLQLNERWLKYGIEHGWDTRLFERYTTSHPPDTQRVTHGMIGITVLPNGQQITHLGVSPLF